jgi:hypothetical protein
MENQYAIHEIRILFMLHIETQNVISGKSVCCIWNVISGKSVYVYGVYVYGMLYLENQFAVYGIRMLYILKIRMLYMLHMKTQNATYGTPECYI